MSKVRSPTGDRGGGAALGWHDQPAPAGSWQPVINMNTRPGILTVARPLSAEQELATQQPSTQHTRQQATTLQLNITASSQLCHQDINNNNSNNMDAPQNLDPTGLY